MKELYVKNILIAEAVQRLGKFMTLSKDLKANVPLNVIRCLYLNLHSFMEEIKSFEVKRKEIIELYSAKDEKGELKLIEGEKGKQYDLLDKEGFDKDFEKLFHEYADKVKVFPLPKLNEVTQMINLDVWIDDKKTENDLLFVFENCVNILTEINKYGKNRLPAIKNGEVKEAVLQD